MIASSRARARAHTHTQLRALRRECEGKGAELAPVLEASQAPALTAPCLTTYAPCLTTYARV